ncbi:MAG: NPCBM/NEW2 domain-containing protein, partial [Planctomycetota bacterium]|nr:NPCBM/NEW2 domain-containing protein [Planctomycetota bacterium]
MLRHSLTALTAAALAAPAMAQRKPLTPPANPRPPRPFVHALSGGTAVWADGTLGPVELDRSVGSAAPGDGGTLQVGSRSFTTGFGTRAPSVVAFDLEGEALLFQSWVGIDEAVGSAGTARFQVLGDGALLFDSGLLGGSDEAVSTGRLDVRGVRELLLVALDGDDGFDQDHADWGDPVVFAPAAPDGSGASSRGVRGSWGPLLPWPVQPVHASLLASG